MIDTNNDNNDNITNDNDDKNKNDDANDAATLIMNKLLQIKIERRPVRQ